MVIHVRRMAIAHVSYDEFLAKQGTLQNPLDLLVNGEKVVHVFALTRDLCPGCKLHKPLYEELATGVSKKLGDRVKFHSIHLNNGEEFDSKRVNFRRLLRFAAFPTYLILLKSEAGIVETYRAVEPSMDDLERNINVAVDLASR